MKRRRHQLNACRPHVLYNADMLDSVRWRVAISCPLCGAAGSAILSESEDDPRCARQIEALSQGFLGTMAGTPPATVFLCVVCQVPAFSEPQGVLGESQLDDSVG
jgi:hypothetical protein